MSFKSLLALYGLTFAVFFLIDLFWLGVVGKAFYRKHLGFLLSPRPRWGAAILFYLLYIAGLILFVIQPALLRGAPLEALLFGALFSLIGYATYDLTNLATIKDWPVVVTVVDLIWGTVLGGSVSLLSAILARSWLKLS
jgi:uncharacterized membrane protein